MENSIVANGCESPLTVWNGTIVDGRNRYDICRKHGMVSAENTAYLRGMIEDAYENTLAIFDNFMINTYGDGADVKARNQSVMRRREVWQSGIANLSHDGTGYCGVFDEVRQKHMTVSFLPLCGGKFCITLIQGSQQKRFIRDVVLSSIGTKPERLPVGNGRKVLPTRGVLFHRGTRLCD